MRNTGVQKVLSDSCRLFARQKSVTKRGPRSVDPFYCKHSFRHCVFLWPYMEFFPIFGWIELTAEWASGRVSDKSPLSQYVIHCTCVQLDDIKTAIIVAFEKHWKSNARLEIVSPQTLEDWMLKRSYSCSLAVHRRPVYRTLIGTGAPCG